ncbi:hypothetical protein BJ742DRAFT_506162 [Cladochytrium replicatum]|nr:hypothetical protein BJ742DRAFT_506162 [Cladochytrium replicatum]
MQFKLVLLFFTALISAISAAPISAQLEARQVNTAVFVKVPLAEPLNWIAGSRLFPSNIIAGYHADLSEYNEDGYVAYILAQCRTFKDCTSFEIFQGNNSGSDGGRFWFGYVYRGGATNPAWYERYDDPTAAVTNSVAYTIKA